MSSQSQTQPSATPSLGQQRASAPIIPPEPPLQPLVRAYVDLPVVQSLYRDAVGRFLTLHKQIREQRHQLSKFRIRCTKTPDSIELPRSIAIVIETRVQFPATKDPSFFAAERKALKAIEQTTTAAVYEQVVAARTRLIAELLRQADPDAFIAEEVQRHRSDIDKFALEVAPRFLGIVSNHAPAAAAAAAATSASPATTFADDAQAHFEKYLNTRVVTEAARIAMEDKEAKEHAAQSHAENEDAREQVMRGAHNSQTISQIAERAAAAVYKSEIKALAPRAQRSAPTPQQSAPKFTLHPAFFTNAPAPSSRKRKHTDADLAAAGTPRIDPNDDRMDIDEPSPSRSDRSTFSRGGVPRNTSRTPHTNGLKRQKKGHQGSAGDSSLHGR